MTTEQPALEAPRDSIPIALIREAIEAGLGIPNPDNISSISITFGGRASGQVNVIRIGKHGAFGETYAIDRSTVECPQCHQEAGRPHTDYCPLRIREEVFAGVQANGTTCPGCGSDDPSVKAFVPGYGNCRDPYNWHNFDATTASVGSTYASTEQGIVLVCPLCAIPVEGPITPDCPACKKRVARAKTAFTDAITEGVTQIIHDAADETVRRAFEGPIAVDTAESLTEQLNAASSFVDDGCRCASRDNHTPGCPALPHDFTQSMEIDERTITEPTCFTCGGGENDPRHT